tara:strand:- start:86 stop:226 length:141 start_codon:yes stop_codon:yes gene_type:complete
MKKPDKEVTIIELLLIIKMMLIDGNSKKTVINFINSVVIGIQEKGK